MHGVNGVFLRFIKIHYLTEKKLIFTGICGLKKYTFLLTKLLDLLKAAIKKMNYNHKAAIKNPASSRVFYGNLRQTVNAKWPSP